MPDSATHRSRRIPSARVLAACALGIIAALWLAPTIAAAVSAIDIEEVDHLYLLIGSFVVFDAVVPIFPSESLLNAASTLAAQPDSDIQLWRLILAGSLGAVIGDSLLYWLSRTVLRRSMAGRVEQARRNEQVAHSMEVLSRTAPLLIVFGRFVPGVRFLLGATMGLTRHPYPSFLLWDAIGGTLWAAYTCVFSYLVATVIEDKPVISLLVSAVITTAILALLFIPIKRTWVASEPAPIDADVSGLA